MQDKGLAPTKGSRRCCYVHTDHFVLPAALSCPGCLVGQGRKGDYGQKTPEGVREIQALGREGEWAIEAAGKDELREDVGSQDEHLALGSFYSYAFSIIFIGWWVDVC